MAEKSGPETYAPPQRRPTEKRNDVERVAALRPQRSEAIPAHGPAPDDLNAVVRRVAGDSMEEIDRVIRLLENVREMIRTEGERVSREIAGYASLSQAAKTAMNIIADSVKQWKNRTEKSGPPSAS
jgi:hypothetical protein